MTALSPPRLDTATPACTCGRPFQRASIVPHGHPLDGCAGVAKPHGDGSWWFWPDRDGDDRFGWIVARDDLEFGA